MLKSIVRPQEPTIVTTAPPLVVNGRGSAVGASPYRRGTTMTNEVDGVKKDYSAKADEVVHTEISLPSNAPSWVFRA